LRTSGEASFGEGWLTKFRWSRLAFVGDFVERLLRLWTQPVGDHSEAAFGEVYADPVVVNGTPMTLAQLVARAKSLQQAFDGLSVQVLDRVETTSRVALAFLMRGRHVGAYISPLGSIAPSGRDIEVRTIDLLAIDAGLISTIWVVADDLGLLTQLGAITLR
jgi:predicted ester cyclase